MSQRSHLVIVANRLPVRHRRKGGQSMWETSPGGLVSALMPILQRDVSGGAWIGWHGARSRAFKPFEHDGVRNVPLNLSTQQVGGYYEGMANATLWPLYHDVVRPPIFRRRWWGAYEEVNLAFAETAAASAAEGATVWVHDYHLHLVPGMLRAMRPDLRIGFFLHIPFPDHRLFAQLPWRKEIVEGTLGADVIGFQTRDDVLNFMDAARRYVEASGDGCAISFQGRACVTGTFPISTDAKRIDALARMDDVQERAARHRRRLGFRKILLGVDRMDYTKGIELRLRAFRELLKSERASPEEVVLVQSCVPTRERVHAYSDLRSEVEELVGQINGEFGDVGRGCVHYLRQSLNMEELISLYLAADVLLVTPVRDGMNLIAKEYVAARHDEGGALVLSEFAGAADELGEAVIVNPHDTTALVMAMERALHLDRADGQRRMAAMRKTVFTHDVYAWADSFLAHLTCGERRDGRVGAGIEVRSAKSNRAINGAIAGSHY